MSDAQVGCIGCLLLYFLYVAAQWMVPVVDSCTRFVVGGELPLAAAVAYNCSVAAGREGAADNHLYHHPPAGSTVVMCCDLLSSWRRCCWTERQPRKK